MLTSPVTISSLRNGEYSVARLSKDNLEDLAFLHLEVYGTPKPGVYFLKKYNTAYTGVENVGFIAYSRERKPVAFYGVIPCFIQFEKEVILVAQSADSMTHRLHRSRGLFNELSNMTFDLCRHLGIKLIFGFPNQNSYPAMVNRLGWIETHKMSRFTIPVSPGLGRFFFNNKKEYQERILSKLVSPRQDFHNSVIDDGYAGINRDKAYYQYKAFENTHVIKIRSADLWIKVTRELIIGDIILKEKSSNIFFDELRALAKKLSLRKISFQVSRDCRLHHLFARHYEAIPSFPVLFKDLGSGLALENIKFTFADIDIF
jgi:hypothetical protein